MSFSNQDALWYAIRTKSRHEKIVRDRLAAEGLEPLLPTIMRMNQWRDRKKKVEMPLFSGYCFAKFPWDERLPVLQVPGVASIVAAGGRPTPVAEAEIEAIRILMHSTLPYDGHPYLRQGMTVEVTRGPLQGLKGILVRKVNACRLVIGVHLIRQAASVEIDASDVVAV